MVLLDFSQITHALTKRIFLHLDCCITIWLIIVEWQRRHKKRNDKCCAVHIRLTEKETCRKKKHIAWHVTLVFINQSDYLHSFGCNKHLILKRRCVMGWKCDDLHNYIVARQARLVFRAFFTSDFPRVFLVSGLVLWLMIWFSLISLFGERYICSMCSLYHQFR